MKAVLMAGGKGTRIASVAADIPKPMLKIDNKPVLEHEIESLKKQGITDLLITVSHLGSVIMDYFGDGSKVSPVTGKEFGVRIEYFVEEMPLGNAGALFKLKDRFNEDFLLLNADVIFEVNFERMMRYHKEKNALITLFTHPNSHPHDSGLIVADQEGRVESWITKEDIRPEFYKNRVNAGVHIVSPQIFEVVDVDVERIGKVDLSTNTVFKVDLDRQVLRPMAGTGCMYCYDSPEYVKDMGTPHRFAQVEKDFLSGCVQTKNLLNKQKAIFLDRDGTINKYVKFLRDINDFELLPGVAKAIQKINSSGYLCIVVTNQPVIARGEATIEELEMIHNKMETLLGNEGAYVDAIYYCPHHPDRGFAGEVDELKIDCECRKPKPGMLLQAAKDFNIDLSKSWMVGDNERDILAGRAVGCRTALITEKNKKDCSGTVLIDNLCQFVKEKYFDY